MWRIWLLFDPRRVLIGNAIFLFTLAIILHFIMLSTDRFNWIEGPGAAPVASIEQTVGSPDAPVTTGRGGASRPARRFACRCPCCRSSSTHRACSGPPGSRMGAMDELALRALIEDISSGRVAPDDAAR